MCTSGLETLRTPSWSLSRHRCLTPTWSKVHGINQSFNNLDTVLYYSCWFEWNYHAVLQVWMYTAIWWPGRVIWKMWRFSEDGCSTFLISMLSPGSYLGEFDLLLMCLKHLQIQKQLKALLFSTDVTVSTASVTLVPCIWELKPSSWTATACRRCSWRGWRWGTWAECRKPSYTSEKPWDWRPVVWTAMKARKTFMIIGIIISSYYVYFVGF